MYVRLARIITKETSPNLSCVSWKCLLTEIRDVDREHYYYISYDTTALFYHVKLTDFETQLYTMTVQFTAKGGGIIVLKDKINFNEICLQEQV